MRNSPEATGRWSRTKQLMLYILTLQTAGCCRHHEDRIANRSLKLFLCILMFEGGLFGNLVHN